MSAQTTAFDVGVPHQVQAPVIAQNPVNGVSAGSAGVKCSC